MNNNIDLTKILKNCPFGWKFWSPIFGKVIFTINQESLGCVNVAIENGDIWSFNADATLTIGNIKSVEIMLYPSIEQRDWNKFTAPWYNNEQKSTNKIEPKFKVGDIIRHKNTNDVYKISEVYYDFYGIEGFDWGIYITSQDKYELVPNKFDPKTLKPFDKILVRDSNLVADSSSSLWKCQILSHIKEESKDYPYVCINEEYSFCIPFNDDTKHLVGTNKQAPEFYRYWEN